LVRKFNKNEKTHPIVTLVVLLLSASFASAQSQQFTLEQAAHGLQHNKEVISSQLEVQPTATKKASNAIPKTALRTI
jgi:hypothetical protein